MKISVLGNIIDTRDIYMITPIVGDEYFKKSEAIGDGMVKPAEMEGCK